MYPFARDHMTDCCYNFITTTPFSLRKEEKQRMQCKYYFVMYISATAALYSKLYSFGMTLVIWSFYIYFNTNCSVYCLNY